MRAAALLASVNRLPIWRRRVRVWDLSLLPPTFDRCLYLWLHRFDRLGHEERAFFSQVIEPGMHVADVGANLGLYSLLFARLVGPAGLVFSFEPDQLMVAALRENLEANTVRHVRVFGCAVGAAAGRAVLRRHAVNSGDNRLGTTAMPLHSGQADVPVCALEDVLAGQRIDFVKIDVQGWEGEALRGIGGLLDANPRLRIYFEFWPHGLSGAGTSVAGFAQIVRGLGLHVWRPLIGEPGPAIDIEALARTMQPGAYTNLLAARVRPH